MVVLPAPLGPRNPSTSPAPTSNERSLTATCDPKRLERCWTLIRLNQECITALASMLPLLHAEATTSEDHMTLTRKQYGWLAGIAGAAFATWWLRRGDAARQLNDAASNRGETIFSNHPVAD